MTNKNNRFQNIIQLIERSNEIKNVDTYDCTLTEVLYDYVLQLFKVSTNTLLRVGYSNAIFYLLRKE